MSKKLLIVESPAKARTIEKYLGNNFKVLASYGHVRDLPKSKLGIDIEQGFMPQYVIPTKARKNLNLIKKEAESATEVLLATDPDREGEAIAWHIAESINNKKIGRILFHEITPEAIKNAVLKPGKLNHDLFYAQQARRLLDRLVGYSLSPLLWRKIRKGLSAGRVQSAAMRIVIDREKEIQAFKPTEYWEIFLNLAKNKNIYYRPKLIKHAGKEIIINTEKEARLLEEKIADQFGVTAVVTREVSKRPTPPFTTSTLQQDAARKLGFTAKKTMMVAQQLYEGVSLDQKGTVGLITYMRTDSMNLSVQFKAEAKDLIRRKFGEAFLNQKERIYKKSKLSQEAHEAIRPTSVQNEPEKIRANLTPDQYKLYALIYSRAVASLMADARYSSIRVDFSDGAFLARANGLKKVFEGFQKIYQEAKDTEEEEKEMKNLELLKEGDKLTLESLDSIQKFTQPPARLNEASLIKILEEKGIGRPSTYAPIISTLLARKYVRLENRKFIPEDIGFIVNDLLEKNFSSIVDLDFTGKMEAELDEIATGERKWQKVLEEFWVPFDKNLKAKTEAIEKVKIPVKETDEICEKCGGKMVIKTGRFGEFLACSNFPDCKNTRPYVKSLGLSCPDCKKGEVVEKRTKKGRLFWGCNQYPDCHYATWKDPRKFKNEKS